MDSCTRFSRTQIIFCAVYRSKTLRFAAAKSSSTLDKTGPGNFYVGPSSSLSVGSFEVLGGQTIVSSGGALMVGGAITNQGTLRLLGNAQLSLGGALINNGVLDIMTWSGTLPPGLVNNGSILDRSAVKVDSCSVVGQDFHLTIMGYAGHTYQLQCANGLHPASWTNLGAPQVGNQAPLVLVHTNAVSASQGFYRVAVE